MSAVEPVVVGRCPGCDRPYTAGEVVASGILRPRSEADGGPWVVFPCPRCDRRIRLVPHGQGRYAPPGSPPPPEVPPEARAPAWAGAAARVAEPARASPPPPPAAGPGPQERGPSDAARGDHAPLSVVEALDVLGISPTADAPAIDAAFRERSLQCHPDKVAHLDPEFRELAERKFKRLREAYDLLRPGS